jgi:hypothetical protein
LEERDDFTLCFHRAKILYEGKLEAGEVYPKYKPKEIVSMEEILDGNFLPTASIMFRSEMIKKIPNWMMAFVFGDWILNIVCAQYGKIGSVDGVMSIYRVHKGGVWTSQYNSIEGRINADMKNLEFYEIAPSYLDKKYFPIINYRHLDFCLGIARNYYRLGEKGKASKYLKQATNIILKSTGLTIKEKIRFIVKVAKLVFLVAFT